MFGKYTRTHADTYMQVAGDHLCEDAVLLRKLIGD